MPWYALTTLNDAGIAIKREILYRKDISKVFKFLSIRCDRMRFAEGAHGFLISEPTAEETWDWDIDEPHEQDPSGRAIEVPLIFGEELNPRR